MRIFQDRDADLGLIRGKTVAIIGYGSQGHAHALNLRDSGVERVIVGLKPGSPSAPKAEAAGFPVRGVREASAAADVVMLLAPDEVLPDLYANEVAPEMGAGKTILLAHGFAVHFGYVDPPPAVDVGMVAPNGPGHMLRSEYEAGRGLACLVAVHRNASGQAFDLCLAYGAALGAGRAAMVETSFREETEADLFGEQVVLCGGLVELIRAGFETLVESGTSPEVAYLECANQLKLIVDLIYVNGVAAMNGKISNTAEYGEYVTGPRLVTADTKAEMKRVLADIQSGKFARDWMAENAAGRPNFEARRRRDAAHPIEAAGANVRALMPWLAKPR